MIMNYDRQGNEASYEEERESSDENDTSDTSGVIDNPEAVEASENQEEHSEMEESLISGIFSISLFFKLWSIVGNPTQLWMDGKSIFTRILKLLYSSGTIE